MMDGLGAIIGKLEEYYGLFISKIIVTIFVVCMILLTIGLVFTNIIWPSILMATTEFEVGGTSLTFVQFIIFVSLTFAVLILIVYIFYELISGFMANNTYAIARHNFKRELEFSANLRGCYQKLLNKTLEILLEMKESDTPKKIEKNIPKICEHLKKVDKMLEEVEALKNSEFEYSIKKVREYNKENRKLRVDARSRVRLAKSIFKSHGKSK